MMALDSVLDRFFKSGCAPLTDIKHSQNFLHDPALVSRVVALAALDVGATVLEIGPGKGIITDALANTVGSTGRVIAVEFDAKLAASLQTRYATTPHVEIVHGDMLEFDLSALDDYAVFSNVPFNITSRVIERLFTEGAPPTQAHLILQRDALISTSAYGDGETFKSLLVKPLYIVKAVYAFQKADFKPRPGVDTALFAFIQRDDALVQRENYALYKDFLAFVSKDRAGEGAWRKLLSRKQLQALQNSAGLVAGRGIKSQQIEAMVGAFNVFREDKSRWGVVADAMGILRREQAAREAVNRKGGHHRSKTYRPKRK